MSKKVAYLQLAPEFGGTKFGPFAAPEIRLGHEQGRNDIVLPEGLGVAPEHAKLVKQPDESFILAPVERTAQVWLWRADGRAPKQIQSPVAVGANDGFSLVSQEGPRFIIVMEYEKKKEDAAAAKDPFAKAKKKLNAGTFAEEIKRQGFARALATGAGNTAQQAFTFIRTGSFLQPRYIILGIMILSGWIFAGSIGCGAIGLGSWGSSKSSQLETCMIDKEICEGNQGGDEDPTVLDITGKMLGDKVEWKRVFDNDKDLALAFKDELKLRRATSSDYSWVWTRRTSPFTKWAAQVDATKGFKENDQLRRVMKYLAVSPGDNQEPDWTFINDSNDVRTCARGPLKMTYRQARQLDLQAQPDAVADGRTVMQGDIESEKAGVAATMVGVNEDFVPDEVTFDGDGTTAQGGWCAYASGGAYPEDDRSPESLSTLSLALSKQLGKDAKGLPAENQPYWIVMRLVKFFAADYDQGNYQTITYVGQSLPPTTLLKQNSALRNPQKDYVKRRVAGVLADAVSLPCFPYLDKEHAQNVPTALTDDQKMATKMQCAMLMFLVDEQ